MSRFKCFEVYFETVRGNVFYTIVSARTTRIAIRQAETLIRADFRNVGIRVYGLRFVTICQVIGGKSVNL